MNERNNLLGFGYQLFAVLFSLLTDIVIKMVVVDIPLIQVMFYRSGAGLPLLIGYLILTNNLQCLKINRPMMHFWRASAGICGMFLFVSSYKHLPLAEASAIIYIAPILITVLSVVILKEKIYTHRIVALILGFVGTLIIMRPSADFNWYFLYPLGGALALSVVTLVAHVLTRTDHPIGVTVTFSIFVATITGAITLYNGFAPLENAAIMWYAIIIGNAGILAVIFNMHAVHECHPSFYAVTKYMSLVAAAVAGLVLFNEPITIYLALGMGFIAGAGIYISYCEHRQNKKNRIRMQIRA